jgi:glycosyltransferase involved in cell wall biosynthesis
VLLSRELPGVLEDYTVDGVSVKRFRDKGDPFVEFPTADLLFCHLDTTERTVILGKQLGKPVVQMVHNDNPYTRGYLGLGAQLAVYNTHWVRESLLAQDDLISPVGSPGVISWRVSRDFSKVPSVVLHPPVSAPLYRTTGPRNRVTLVNLWDGDGERCGKGPGVFYELAREFPDIPFLGVRGGYGDQDVRKLKNVKVMDNVSDMREVYSQTKILLMPSRYESFGRVAIEAAASGIPTIASPTQGLIEALGVGGLFAKLTELGRWHKLVKNLYKDPDFYYDAVWYARERSDYWAKETSQELQDFCDAAEQTVREWRVDGLHRN